MANDWQAIADIARARVTDALRHWCIFPRLVNFDISDQVARPNSVINVPVYPPFQAVPVTSGRGNESPAQDMTPRNVDVKLDNWVHVPFEMDDHEMWTIEQDRSLTPALRRASIAVANAVNGDIVNKLYQSAYQLATKAGAEAAYSDLVSMRRLLEKSEAMDDGQRVAVWNHDFANDLLNDSRFTSANEAGTDTALVTGNLPRRAGFENFEAGGMPSHTAGTVTGMTVNGEHLAEPTQSGGYSTIRFNATASDLKAGDRVTFTGHTQQYSLRRDATGTSGDLQVFPSLQETVADGAAVSLVNDGASYDVGALAFHPQVFAFGSRPLSTDSAGNPSEVTSSFVDSGPKGSQLAFRLTGSRVNFKNRWTIDVLFGGETIYGELVTRLK